MFADDTKCHRAFRNLQDREILQSDLNNITNWCQDWRMDSNKSKCGVLQFSRCFQPTINQYTLVDIPVKPLTCVNDLGVSITKDIQVVIDHYACVEYLTKYAAKSEPRSPILKQAFNSIVQNVDSNTDPCRVIKKVVMKSLGERDYAAQETMHHLLSLKLHSSTFKVMPVSLNGSRRVRDISSIDEGESCTDCSLLDVYANREQYESSQNVINMNFVQFATTYKVVNNELTKLPENVIPQIFPTYSPYPKGPNFGLYCKYQLLRYKPWRTTQNNAWGDQEPTDEVLINCWHEFLQTPYGQSNVPDWFDKLQAVIQTQESEDEPSEEQDTTREEWMILSDLNTPFDNSVQTPESTYDWHLDRANHSEQQIHEMPTWIKTNKEEYSIDEQYDVVDINSFSERQKLAYDINC